VNRHINVIRIVGLSVAALVAPQTIAVANPLLSGYGGPGQGSQAILGSALVNGPPRGGGGGGGANNSGSAAPRSGGGVGGAAVGVRGNAASTTAAASGQGRSSGRPARGAGGQVKAQPSTGSVVLYPASERAGNAQGGLGLSADDLLYIILALGALAFAAVFTRRLTRGTTASGRRG
jgi:hypothetical protein